MSNTQTHMLWMVDRWVTHIHMVVWLPSTACEFVCCSSDYRPQHVSSCVTHLITIHSMWVCVLLIWLPSTTMWDCVLLICLPSTTMWVRVLLICLPSTACEFVCYSSDYHPQHVSLCVTHLITIHSMWVCVLLIWLPSKTMWVCVLLIWLPSTTMWVYVLLIWLPSSTACEFVC
jgi:hypothetical protein